MMRLFPLILIFFSLVSGLPAQTESGRGQHSTLTLIPENSGIVPGLPFTVALEMRMEPQWHTYWQNPGDSGFPTQIQWTLPPGFVAGPIQWPTPHLIFQPPLMSYGYEDNVWLLVAITPPSTLPLGSLVPLRAKVKWLECREECIPGNAELLLNLPVKGSPEPVSSKRQQDFQKARSLLPSPEAPQRLTAELSGSIVRIRAELPVGNSDGDQIISAHYFPIQEEVIQNAKEQVFKVEDQPGLKMITLSLSSLSSLTTPPERLHGVLQLVRSAQEPLNLIVDVPLKVTAPEKNPLTLPTRPAPVFSWSLLLFALLGAFIGGLLLNLMPCVLPVLSLKVLGLIGQAGSGKSPPFLHGLAFTAGVLITYWSLAGVLLILQATGQQLGWGFQLQNPTVVALLIFLFFLIALNLFGVFEVAIPGLSSSGHSSGLIQSGLNGLLATVVATPCTAPFLGSALGFALSQPAPLTWGIFTAMGLGMSAPYLLLTSSPGLLRFLPKPGAWMETFKQAMAFPMLATVIWLAWVYVHQKESDALISLCIGLLLVSLAAWFYGRFGGPTKPAGTRLASALVGLGLLLVGVGMTVMKPLQVPPGELVEVNWEKFDPVRLDKLRSQGQPVFVNFTAAWCLSCQVNKRLVLHAAEVEKKFLDKKVILMEADWTNEDPHIAAVLAGYGRRSVPVYVLYGRTAGADPMLLPEILTNDIVLKALDSLGN